MLAQKANIERFYHRGQVFSVMVAIPSWAYALSNIMKNLVQAK